MEQVTTFLNDGTLRFCEEIMMQLIHNEKAFIEKAEEIKEFFLHYWTELDNSAEFCVPCTVTDLPFIFLFRYLLGASGPLVSTRDG
jgi:hypothetical protein